MKKLVGSYRHSIFHPYYKNIEDVLIFINHLNKIIRNINESFSLNLFVTLINTLVYNIVIIFAVGVSFRVVLKFNNSPFDYEGTFIFIIVMHGSLLQITLSCHLTNFKV